MAGWQTKPLAEVIAPMESADPSRRPHETFTYVDVSSVSADSCSIERPSLVLGRDAPSRARRRIRAGDVVFATIRPTLKRIAVVPDELDGEVCSTGFFVFRPKPILDARYLFYFLLTDGFMDAMERLQTGASYPAVNDTQVKSQLISFPLLPEQKRIVAILDEAFEGIRIATANAEKNLANARELFEAHVRACFARNNGTWRECYLPDVSVNLDSRRVPITKRDRKPGEVPYYGASGVVDRVEGWLFDEDLLLVSEDGANLLARSTPIAFSITGRTWVNNHAHVLRFADPLLQELVELYLNSITLEPHVSGMAQPKLNQAALNAIPLIIPPEPTLRELVSSARDVRDHSGMLRQRYEQQAGSVETLKQSILARAFSGQLTASKGLAA